MADYILEDRGYGWMYHWIVYMLGGLRHLTSSKSENIVKFYFDLKNDQGYHSESLDIIKDKYMLVPPSQTAKYHHGEPLIRPDHVHPDTYVFLRNLFNSQIYSQVPGLPRFVYITRKDCGTRNPANNGKHIRQVLNELEFIPILQSMGFELLQFEDLTFANKIRTFQSSSLIVSPNSGSLTFSLFASPKTQIIEILPENIEHHDHYKNICQHLNISYTRFTNISTVGERPALGNVWNMQVNVPLFIQFIESKMREFT